MDDAATEVADVAVDAFTADRGHVMTSDENKFRSMSSSTSPVNVVVVSQHALRDLDKKCLILERWRSPGPGRQLRVMKAVRAIIYSRDR